MLVQSVNKTDSIENIINRKFVFCKELNKGFIKRDLGSLGTTDYSFENVVAIIESMSLEQLELNGLNSVIFFNGEEKISYKMKKKIVKEIENLPKEQKTEAIIQSMLSFKRTKSDYFNDTFIDEIIQEFVSSGFDVSVVNKITAPDGAADDFFGNSVAISGSNIVVGVHSDDDKGVESGSAYIYDTSGNFIKKIVPTDGDTSDRFGQSVAISDSNIVVGSYGDDDKGSSSGSAYIYDTSGNFIRKITAPDGVSDDHFGYSVATSGNTIVVGSHDDDDKGTSSGSAYIYDAAGNFIRKITASDGAYADFFGYSVATSGSNIVVGAYHDDDKGSASGSAYIYDTSGNFINKITAPDGVVTDYFGWSVAISGSNIVVGAHADDDKGGESGSAYIYDTAGNFINKITAPDGASGDNFGYSVTISDSNIVIGAYGDDDKGDESGSAYIYDTSGNFINKITAPDGAVYDYFGVSVAISGSNIVVGARYDDDKGNSSGSVYIFG